MLLKEWMPCRDGRVAVISFFISIITFFVMVVEQVDWWAIPLSEGVAYFIMILIIDVKIVQLIFIVHSLGLIFSVGGLITLSGNAFWSFGLYMMALSFFHWSEYITTSIFNASSLSLDSFLINHSREYGIAAILSWLEFWVELHFFPSLKQFRIVCLIGLIMVISGETLRKVSMFTAGSNFTHQVQVVKRPNHVLVTTGIYSIFRHPSYVGWFYWSIGTQVLLLNPLCTIGYSLASWNFFKERIEDEEQMLLCFFGEEYSKYREKVLIGIPFLTGYKQKTS